GIGDYKVTGVQTCALPIYQRVVGEDARDLAPERLVHAVVVVGVQEPALLEVAAQDLELLVREADVAVPRHIDERDVPQLRSRERDDALPFGDLQRGALAQRGEEVRQARWIRVPVAAAVVMQTTDGQLRIADCGLRIRRGDVRCAQSAIANPRSAIGSAGERQPECGKDDGQGFHSSFTSRYAVFRVIPVSAARRSATSLRVIPCASRARARSSGSGGRSSRAGRPAPATTTVTSPRTGARA